MLSQIWNVAASPAACVLAGFLGLIVLLISGCHRDKNGNTRTSSMVAITLLSLTLYTLLLLVVGQFFLRLPVATTITQLGNERMAFVFIGLSADIFARIHRLFDNT
jgi:hypothetical protein